MSDNIRITPLACNTKKTVSILIEGDLLSSLISPVVNDGAVFSLKKSDNPKWFIVTSNVQWSFSIPCNWIFKLHLWSAIRTSTMQSRLFIHAMCNGVLPNLSGMLRSHSCLLTRTQTMSKWPCSHAMWRGVSPQLSSVFISQSLLLSCEVTSFNFPLIQDLRSWLMFFRQRQLHYYENWVY